MSQPQWSGAFISWAMTTAFGRAAFPARSAHADYANLIRSGGYPFTALDPAVTPPQVGDIIINVRSDGSTGTSTIGMKFSDNPWRSPGHGDIVVRVNSTSVFAIGGNKGAGNVSGQSNPLQNGKLDPNRFYVILRPNASLNIASLTAILLQEESIWRTNKWTQNSPEAEPYLKKYWSSVGYIYQQSNFVAATAPFNYALVPPGENAPSASISPFLGSLESFHPNIQYELTRRRIAENTIHSHIPFVKLTSLVEVQSTHLQGTPKAWCPSLGIHGEPEVTFEDIYLPQDNRSIIGYAFTTAQVNGRYTRIPVVVPNNNANATDTNTIAGQATDQRRIPMPGIAEVNAERGTAGGFGVRGGLMKAELKILAYSIGQINTLLTYYLRPSTRVVLEWGRVSSNPEEKIFPYPWEQKNAAQIADDFTALLLNPKAQTAFINNHIYSSNGNYEIFIGYVAKFDLKYNKNNVYEVSLTIHSVQQFEMPTIHTGVKSLCFNAVDKCRVMDIREYFDETYSWKPNSFRNLLNAEAERATPSPQTQQREPASPGTKRGYGDHVIGIKNAAPGTSGAGSVQAGTQENEFYVSWKFFVEKILNDPLRGVLSLIPSDNGSATDPTNEPRTINTQELLRLGMLRPIQSISQEELLRKSKTQLVANEVGYHPNLRSTNPEVMVIYNPTAQNKRSANERQSFLDLQNAAVREPEDREEFTKNTHIMEWMRRSDVGPFKNIQGTGEQASSGLLTEGVWINTKAIKQAFMSTDTATAAINSLLSSMNAATEGYWNLQLYSTDRHNSGLFVVDMGLSKRIQPTSQPTVASETNKVEIDPEERESNNILRGISDVTPYRYRLEDPSVENDKFMVKGYKPKYRYMFNRGIKRFSDGELGSDLIDLNIEFGLPQAIAVQAIAGVGGAAQKSTLNAINVKELQEISLLKNIFTECDDTCTDADCSDNTTQLNQLVALKNQTAEELIKFNTNNPPGGEASPSDPVTPVAGGVETQRQQLQDAATKAATDYEYALVQRSFGTTMVIDKFRELASLGTLLEYVEFNPSAMIRKLNLDSTNAEDGRPLPFAHAFNSSNLTKTVVSLTLPGIGGIELFQSFQVDRVPSILDSGFYMVTKVNHKFSPNSGWTTTLEGRYRYDPNASGTTEQYDKNCTEVEPTERPISRPPVTGGRRSGPIGTYDLPAQDWTTITRYVPSNSEPFGYRNTLTRLLGQYQPMTDVQLVNLRMQLAKQYINKIKEYETARLGTPRRPQLEADLTTLEVQLNVLDEEIRIRATAPFNIRGPSPIFALYSLDRNSRTGIVYGYPTNKLFERGWAIRGRGYIPRDPLPRIPPSPAR